jgi:hypothetical protein
VILKKIGSKNFVVNYIADLILDKIGKEYSSVIEVADCINFFIVKGKTNSTSILNLSDIISEFKESNHSLFGEKRIVNVIDLIEYNVKLDEVMLLTQTLHDGENCSYSSEQIKLYSNNEHSVSGDYYPKPIPENNLIYKSEFPHGYSLTQGRSLFYYLKQIYYSIPSTYPVSTLTMSITKSISGDTTIEVYNHFYNEKDSVLESAILDSFNFNYIKLESKMKKVDWSVELTNPLEDYSELKEINKMMII